MPTLTTSLSPDAHMDLITPRALIDLHPETLFSGLVLIALLTYFYTAFSKIIQPGGEQPEKRGAGSRIYYSSAAAV